MALIWPIARTPEVDEPQLREFAQGIKADGAVVHIERAAALRPFSNCYWNVAAETGNHGGAIQFGWLFHLWPRSHFAAMHHAVLRKPGGELLDVTESYPTDPVKTHSTFLCDDAFNLDLTRPPNVESRYRALNDRPQFRAFVAAYRKKHAAEGILNDLSYKAGYRGEGQFAKAAGTTPPEIEVPPQLKWAYQSALAARERANVELGSAITALRAITK